MSDHQASASPTVVNNNTMDAIVAAILLLIGIVVMFEANRLGSSWTDDGPGSGYFPFYIGLILCVSALGIFYQAVLSKSKDTGAFVDREQLGRVLSVLLPAGVFVLAITFLGIYIASAVYITLFMVILGKYSKAKSLFLGVAVAAFFFVLFEVWFKVPLYKGNLDPLGFLGY
ncbi:tripartite tricarboxylate transporter TctB family protein [Piscinibacter sakaiensis]|uniref:tripartite tricarboxylate transporter TctB family protein n=1 Tax=Piscinibacter sakaiensis TaxID=1547922 RepID=UPI003AAE6A07